MSVSFVRKLRPYAASLNVEFPRLQTTIGTAESPGSEGVVMKV
jgi:hypothetical protein